MLARLVAIPLALLLMTLNVGCVSFDRGYGSTRVCATTPGTMTVNGEPVAYNKENLVRVYGPPTYTLPVAEGEVCIWRDTILRRLGKFMPTDYIIGFDARGNFRAVDPNPNITYGFCTHCGYDVSRVSGNRCPQCGAALPEAGLPHSGCAASSAPAGSGPGRCTKGQH